MLQVNTDAYYGTFDGHLTDFLTDAPQDDFVADAFYDSPKDVHFTAMTGPRSVQFKLRIGLLADQAALVNLVENTYAKLTDEKAL